MCVRRDLIDRGDVRAISSTYSNDFWRHRCVRVKLRTMVCGTLRFVSPFANRSSLRALTPLLLQCSTGLRSALERVICVSLLSLLTLFLAQITGRRVCAAAQPAGCLRAPC